VGWGTDFEGAGVLLHPSHLQLTHSSMMSQGVLKGFVADSFLEGHKALVYIIMIRSPPLSIRS
jgi:hypothetical protein